MTQRTKIVGARTPVIWLLIVISLIFIAALAVGGLVIYPQLQKQQAERARGAEAEQHYQAGVAFQNVSDWTAAEGEYKQVIILDATYKDAQSRLAEVKARLAGSAATATAVAITQAGQTQATVQAMATAAPAATAQAVEAHYQKALGYINLHRWTEAKAELELVLAQDPNYKDLQTKMQEVETSIASMTPTNVAVSPTSSKPTLTPLPAIAQSSYFDGTNMEGWTFMNGSMTNPGTGGSGGGANNGCLYSQPPSEGKTSYYVAPAKYYGDWSGYSKLKVDLWSAGGGYGSDGDIFLHSGKMTAQRLLPHRPATHWETFIILLRNDGDWTFSGGATRLEDVLANVTGLEIRAEYGDGADESGLDNVELAR